MKHKFTQNVGEKANPTPTDDMRNAPNMANLLFISIKDGKAEEETLAKSVDGFEDPGKSLQDVKLKMSTNNYWQYGLRESECHLHSLKGENARTNPLNRLYGPKS